MLAPRSRTKLTRPGIRRSPVRSDGYPPAGRTGSPVCAGRNGQARRSVRPAPTRRPSAPRTGRMLVEPMKAATKASLAGDRSRAAAGLADAALAHDHDQVGHGHRLALVVRDDDRGDAEAALQAAEARPASPRAAWRRAPRAARRAGTAAASAPARARWRRAAAGRRRACRPAGRQSRADAPASEAPRRAPSARPGAAADAQADRRCSRRRSDAETAPATGTPCRNRAGASAGR